MKITNYPDGSSYVTVDDTDKQIINWRLNSYNDLWQLGQFVDAYNYKFKGYPIIVLPHLFDGQADKRFKDEESSGLKLVLDYLSGLKAEFNIFHPHNAEVVEARLPTSIIIDNEIFITEVLDKLNVSRDGLDSNLVLLSPDAGAFKYMSKLADRLGWKGKTTSGAKSRSWSEEDGTKFIQSLPDFDFEGKDVLIIDDICIYGGTLKGLSNLLEERGVRNIYAAVSHLTIENHKGQDTVFNYFDKIFVTNSKYENYFIEDHNGEAYQPENLEIIKLFEHDNVQKGQ